MSEPVRVDSIADQIARQPASVFHGTRVSMAEKIIADGFTPLPVDEQIAWIAAEYDIAVQALMDDMKTHGSFAVVDERLDTVFVVGDRVKAGSWAERAPEATWEALWAVFRIRHPEVGWYWNSSQEGHLWVRAQRLDDPPAVLEAASPLIALRRRHRDVTAADEFLAAVKTGDLEEVEQQGRLFRITPEWLVHPQGLIPTGFLRVPTRVDDDLLFFMSGESADTFREQMRSGFWGERGAVSGPGDRPWFPLDQVWSRLRGDRQAELEELVGVPITSLLTAESEEAGELAAEA